MSWEHYTANIKSWPEVGLAMDWSLLGFAPGFLEAMDGPMRKALAEMEALEKGAIANPDEGRMVGHYWLRAPELAPEAALTDAIRATVKQIEALAADVHAGTLAGAGGKFTDLLVIGIGGSALGPQFVAEALGHPKSDRMAVHFFDNTDPDGMARTLGKLEGRLGQTLAVVISKSGGTPETRNGMLTAQAAWKVSGLDFAAHAIAITGEGSKLDKVAVDEGWLARLPMWDWVGGRTSETAAVGLLPAALQGLDVAAFLRGARDMDVATREAEPGDNPAAMMALAWYSASEGRGAKDLVILPYKDRLGLLSKYLQQLIMESLGKELDLAGRVVNQGLAVYGNKGSTDQHAYVQQLREGVANFFATFIEVLTDGEGSALEVEEGVTAGDFLQGFFLGTRRALAEKGRASLTLTVDAVTPETVGGLIALFERTVGLYASLIGINAYHQPGVEAGKKAAAGILARQKAIQEYLAAQPGKSFTALELAAALGVKETAEEVFQIARHLAANPAKGIQAVTGSTLAEMRFGKI